MFRVRGQNYTLTFRQSLLFIVKPIQLQQYTYTYLKIKQLPTQLIISVFNIRALERLGDWEPYKYLNNYFKQLSTYHLYIMIKLIIMVGQS